LITLGAWSEVLNAGGCLPGYSEREQGRSDDWPLDYMGKDYRGTGARGWEIMTVGTEGIFYDSMAETIFWSDIEVLDFVMGVLAGL